MSDELGLKFIFKHGVADENRLDLYDASVALNGIARSLAITTHALLSGEVKTQGQSARGARLYMLPSRKGSFVIETAIWIGAAVSSGLFYDFLKYSFDETVGKSDEEQELSRSLLKRIEPTMGELPASLESALQDVHRPIKQDHKMSLIIARPRGEILTEFNASTAEYLEPHVVSVEEPIIGNVTRYNTNSRWGKFFDRGQGRTVSFHLGPHVMEYERSLITWSLHETNLLREGTLHLSATAVITPTEKIKRYNVVKVSRPSF